MKIGEYVWYRNAYGELQGPYELVKIDEDGWAYLRSGRGTVKHVYEDKLRRIHERV